MIDLVVRDGQGYVNGLTPEAHAVLDKATSFRPVGYQFAKAYKRGKSDGRVRLLKHSKFPAGLVGRISDTLSAHDIEYSLSIEQPDPGSKPDLELRTIGIESRLYQDDAVEAALLNARGVIRAPTGAGKTAIGARVIVVRGKWALVVVPTIDLLYQYKRFLEEHLKNAHVNRWSEAAHIQVGQLGDGIVDPQPVTVATVRTAAKALGVAYEKYEFGELDDSERDTDVSPTKLREWIEKIGTLLIDEVHIVGAQTAYDVATKMPCPNKYGMSASPWRDDGADLMIEAATGKVIYRITAKELVDDGYLVPPIIEVVDTAGWWIPAAWGQTCSRCGVTRPMTHTGPAKTCSCGSTRWRSEFTDAYRAEIVENPVRNHWISVKVGQLSGPTLVLVKQKKHGRAFEALIPGSLFLSGDHTGKERTEAYDAVREGRLRVVIATTIADLGLDIPALQNLVLAGGGKSSTRHLQRVGRVARPYKGKTFARVVDYDDGHVHRWFRDHAAARRKIEIAEWGESALWI